MRRLQAAPNLAIATLWADLLREAGIVVSVQREYTAGLLGEIPPDHALPELWVQHDEQLERARGLLRDLQQMPQRLWTCPGCGERVEGPFEQCWNCGTAMPSGADGVPGAR